MTTIRYELPQESEAELAVYNLLGQKLRVLASGKQPAGRYRVVWDGRTGSGLEVSSGIYFYRLATPQYQSQGKMLLTR